MDNVLIGSFSFLQLNYNIYTILKNNTYFFIIIYKKVIFLEGGIMVERICV